MTQHKRISLSLWLGFLCTINFSQPAGNQVSGNLIQFNDNGAWCWYQDERAVVDTTLGKIIIGSVASGSGTGGKIRNGSVEAVIFELSSRMPKRYVLADWKDNCDDHNAPAFLIRPDGKYLSAYTAHYDKYCSRFRIFNGTEWEPELQFDWTTIPGGTDYTIAYSNLLYLSLENRIYNFARANHRSPNLICSDDFGDDWHYGGQLTSNSSHTYNKGYYKYWGNGIDRIDFILTEQHPRDTSTSIYHGFIRNGKSYASDGSMADSSIFDTLDIPSFHDFTPVFRDGTVIAGKAMRRCWISDLVRYKDGRISAIITARINDNEGGGSASVNPRHALIYCLFNGHEWAYSYMCEAGLKMYASEQDYTGLGALSPEDPNTVYLSTSVDPRDDTTDLTFHEIFRGITADEGRTWRWSPVTWNSECDNFRPIIPAWKTNHTALLWWRGKYTSAQNYDAAVVGIIEDPGETTGPVKYVSARRQGSSRPQDFLISEDSSGIYDVWVNFGESPQAGSTIRAGLEPGNLQSFRPELCRKVNSLCQAYLGRVKITARGSFRVYTEGEIIPAGISYARVGRSNHEE